jgi:transposase
MREECSMARRKRRQFTPEFRAEAVRLTQVGDRSIAKVAEDLDLTETSLREWVKRAEVDAGRGAPEALTTSEREELARLRRENKTLRMEREILKQAATFFAKERA